jgi:hypothetical protein
MGSLSSLLEQPETVLEIEPMVKVELVRILHISESVEVHHDHRQLCV